MAQTPETLTEINRCQPEYQEVQKDWLNCLCANEAQYNSIENAFATIVVIVGTVVLISLLILIYS